MPERPKCSLPLQCPLCQHIWIFWVEVPMEMGAFVARFKAQETCPKCGNKSHAHGKGIRMLEGKEAMLALAELS